MTNTPEFAAGPNFQARIDAITARTLTPENIDTYADDALNALIGVVTTATDQYRTFPTVGYETGAEEERAAFSYFGLDEGRVETTLDHISKQAETIRDLDGVIERITVLTGRVITPPALGSVIITPSARHLGPRQQVPRLKTLLFVANKAFGVDLEDREQCTVFEGEVDPNAMRRQSYKLVLLPTINRAVLVCDQERNATFVFDMDLLAGAHVDAEYLMDMTKDEIQDFLEAHPAAGYWLRYSHHYTENIVSLLNVIPQRPGPIPVDEDGARFLHAGNRAPRGLFSLPDVAREFGATPAVAETAVAALSDALGKVIEHTFGNGSTGPVLTMDQKAQVGVWLAANGYLVEGAGADDRSINRMSREWHVGVRPLERAIEALGDELGAPSRRRVANGYADVYMPTQQALIRDWLVARGRVIHTGPGVRKFSANQLAPVAGLSGRTVGKILGTHAVRLGIETKGPRRYLLEPQLQVFRALLIELGYTLPQPPVDPS